MSWANDPTQKLNNRGRIVVNNLQILIIMWLPYAKVAEYHCTNKKKTTKKEDFEKGLYKKGRF